MTLPHTRASFERKTSFQNSQGPGYFFVTFAPGSGSAFPNVIRSVVILARCDIFWPHTENGVWAIWNRHTDVLSFKNNTLLKQIVLVRIHICFCFEVKEASQEAQMVFTARHAPITFQTDGETWREQKEKKSGFDGWHLNWSFCTLLDTFLYHRMNKSPLFLQHPTHLEKHLSLARLLQRFL